MQYFTTYFFHDLDIHIAHMLIGAIILTLIYEFINGFHDTANSVTTVIYTCALKAKLAVIMSSLFNFLGVILSGLSVAYTIIYLLPINLLSESNVTHYLAMIFSMLLAAIIWNLGTWYFGLPASSSHTLIGTIIGIGIINALITNNSIIKTLNTSKLIEIIISLIISPIIGLILGGLITSLLYLSLNNKKKEHYIHLTPSEKKKKDGKRQPAFWPRVALIISAAGVSFSHGANDGQKGIGLIMLILIGVIPETFMVNLNANGYEIKSTQIAIYHLQEYYNQHSDKITKFFENYNNQIMEMTKTNKTAYCPLHYFSKKNDNNITLHKQTQIQNIHNDQDKIINNINIITSLLKDIHDYNQISPMERSHVRNILIYLANITDQISKIPETSNMEKHMLHNIHKNLLITVEYAPMWIIIAVAISLSLGTIIGWRRITSTIGEKIGKKEMTYAQGLSAQITTGISISIASYTGIPMSTTHILSSAVTGTMIAHGYGLQSKTIKNILLTWILTLPIAISLTGILYWFFLKYILNT